MTRSLVDTDVSAWCYRLCSCAGVLLLFACSSARNPDTSSEDRHLAAPRSVPSASNSDTSSQDAGTASVKCAPSCADQCGAPDGCGGKCRCAVGQSCTKGSCVPDPTCAACKANETCSNGACVCTPQCVNNDCNPDGCGGTCPCPSGAVQNAAGQFVQPSLCTDTCVSAGWACGTLCSTSCGTCAAGQVCSSGKCLCDPKCDGSSCHDGCGGVCPCGEGQSCDASGACVETAKCTDTCQSTGAVCGEVCGGLCGTCPAGLTCLEGQCRDTNSCTDCSLKLQILDRKTVDGSLTEVTAILLYQPAENEVRPRMADLRIRASKKVTVLSVETGEALTSAGKSLYTDDLTGKSWRVRADGSVQLLAYGAANSKTIERGQLAKVSYRVEETGPVHFWLVRRLQSFAPLAADQVLQISSYDNAAVVNP